MKLITFAASKGGTGKTSAAVHVAAAWARAGRRVVLVDLDAGRSASTWAGVNPGERTIRDALHGRARLADLVQPSPRLRGVGVVPGSLDLMRAERELSGDAQPGRLRRALAGLKADAVILDTRPGASPLVLEAVDVAGVIVTPVDLSPLGLAGADGFAAVVDAIGRRARLRFLPSRARLYTRVHADGLARLKREHGAAVLPVVIPEASRVAEAAGRGRVVLDVKHPAADAYGRLARLLGGAS